MKNNYFKAVRLCQAGSLLLALGLATAARAQAPSFGPMSEYATGGARPYFVATADLNHDNVPDIVSSNLDGDNLGVLLGRVAGGFAPAVAYSLGAGFSPEEVVLADTNGDGQLDIVVSGRATTNVAVLRGTGSGTFGPVQLYPTGSSAGTFALKMADVTQDGILDVVGANIGNRVYVLPGTAAGGFGTPVGYTVGASLRGLDLALADFNGDSRPDIVVNDASESAVFVLLSQGSGFASPVRYATSTPGYFAEVGDLNQDGQPDIIVGQGPSGGNVTVLTGKPGGTFNAAVNYPVGGTNDFISGVTVGDVTGDGLPDVVAANATQGKVAVLPGTGAGALGKATVFAAGGFAYDVTLADINRDGKPDIVVANANSNSVGVLLSNTPLAALALTALNPGSGPIGTSVTLTGTGLSGATGVTFNGVAAAAYVVNSSTSITATVPTGATTGSVTVTTGGGTSNGLLFTVTYPDLVITTTTTVPAGIYNSITVNSPGNATLAGAVTVNTSTTVNSGATLNDGCFVLSGAGSFTLAAGATLGICNANGIAASGATGAIQNTGARSFASDASYVYNGTASQVTGSGLPSQVRNLTSTNSNAVTLSGALAIRQVLALNAGDLNLNGQGLTLLSDASGTALIANLGAGQVQGPTTTVQRYLDPTLNPGLGYRHLAAPVSNNTVAAFGSGGTTPVVNSAYNSAANPGTVTPFPTVYRYDQSRLATSPATTLSTFDKGWVSPASLSDGADLAFTGFTVQLPGASTLNFTGQVAGSSGSIPLRRATDATAADAGLNLVGNPYPSPLDLSTITAAQRTNMDAAFYVFESTSQYGGAYRSYVNGVASTGGSSLIGTAQAFFVRVTAGQASGSLALNNGNRLTTYGPQAPVRRTAADPRPLVRLALQGANGPADGFVAYAQAGATAGFDGEYDAAKLPNSTGLNLSSATPTGSLSIDGRPAFTTATVLALNVGVPAAGTYSLAAAELANLPAGLTATLRDAATGQLTPLAAGTSYRFSVSATEATALLTGRFTLHFSAATPLATAASLAASEVTVYPNPAQGRFTVRVPAVAGASQVQAELLNTLGQVVRRQSASLPAAGATLPVEAAGLAAGVYTLRLTAGASTLAKRVVLH